MTNKAAESDDRHAIKELCGKYCHLLDQGDLANWQQLFVEEGIFEVSAFGLEGRGRSSLGGFIMQILPFEFGDFKHLPAGHTVEFESGRELAKGVLDFQFIVLERQEPRVALVGFYEDEYRKEDGVWRFAKRSVVPMMVGTSLATAMAARSS